MGRIYVIRNTKNNKLYIGQTKRAFEERYYGHGIGAEKVYNTLLDRKKYGEGYNEHLLLSMEKHGVDSFEVIEDFHIAEDKDLNKLEMMYIAIYKSDNPKYGYNKTKGGEGGGKPDRVICVNDGRVFSSHKEAETHYNIPKGYVGDKKYIPYIPERYYRFRTFTSEKFCKFCLKETSKLKNGYCSKCGTMKKRLENIRKYTQVNGMVKGVEGDLIPYGSILSPIRKKVSGKAYEVVVDGKIIDLIQIKSDNLDGLLSMVSDRYELIEVPSKYVNIVLTNGLEKYVKARESGIL